MKHCVWLGAPNAYRNQDTILMPPSPNNPKKSNSKMIYSPSGHHINHARTYASAAIRGGVTPFNLVQFPNTYQRSCSAAHGHGAGTPHALTKWWVNYITKPGDLIVDPFSGVGTTGLVALTEGRNYIGIEKHAAYHQTALDRLTKLSPCQAPTEDSSTMDTGQSDC
jgi:DNA modification methylase